jgi:hypothetical protein
MLRKTSPLSASCRRQRLLAEGWIDPWPDEEKLLPGQNWDMEIEKAVEALKEALLEEGASLINRVIRESVESTERAKQAMRDNLIEFTGETLAEEASSELVQQELAAMSQLVTERVENANDKELSLVSTLADIAKEFAHIEIGKDTPKKDLNIILSRFPKTRDVKG